MDGSHERWQGCGTGVRQGLLTPFESRSYVGLERSKAPLRTRPPAFDVNRQAEVRISEAWLRMLRKIELVDLEVNAWGTGAASNVVNGNGKRCASRSRHAGENGSAGRTHLLVRRVTNKDP